MLREAWGRLLTTAQRRLGHRQLEVTDASYARILAASSRQQLDVHIWAERALLAHVEASERQVEAERSGRAAQEAAFRAADEAEGFLDSNLPRIPNLPPSTYMDAHPCRWLAKTYPDRRFGPGECEGTCANPIQKGRPCFWTGPAARNCSLFDLAVKPSLLDTFLPKPK